MNQDSNLSNAKPMTIFWLVKTTPQWLAMPPLGDGGRFDFARNVLKPIIAKYPQVSLRFFDAEAFCSLCTDVMQWSVHNMQQYSAMVEDLRETAFWDHYFQVLHIVPTVEDGYAEHYAQETVGKKRVLAS